MQLIHVGGVVCVAMVIACGSSSNSDPDAAAPLCGNGQINPGEECDDGNNSDADDCTNECLIACGDGVVGPAEQCDTAIAAGMPGSCPTECADTDVCTSDRLVGMDCQQACENPVITDFVDGDSCCPAVVDNFAFNDLDCAPVCGNGLVEMGETCDTAISAGEVGACPSDCADTEACTVDELIVPPDVVVGDGACRAYCAYSEFTSVADGDGCCPAGADYTTDDDCVGNRTNGTTTCGNGVRNGGLGELCDTAIAAGMPGACPTSCMNADPCVNSLLLSGGTCKAKCYEWDTNYPQNDDMCCPIFYGGNNRNDNDCTSSCGTPAEECTTPGVGTCDADCRVVRTAFRATTITMQDPHIYWDLGSGNCADLTSVVNSSTIPDAIRQDVDGDGWADLVWIHMFKPLDQSQPTNAYELLFGKCKPGDALTANCEGDPNVERLVTTATNMDTGACLDILAGTVTASYGTPPVVPMGPCFVSGVFNQDIALGSLVVPLQEGYVAAAYVGDPSDGLMQGMVRGFVTEAAALATVLPKTVPILGGLRLYDILAGGITPGSCTIGGTDPIGDDRDLGPDGVTMGWYFYVNFTANTVPFVDKPTASE